MATRKDRGIALILSFLVLTLLTVVVLELVFSARVELSLAQNFRDGLENTWAARSGVEIARGMIAGSWSSFDSPREEWIAGRTRLKIGEAEVSLQLRDEESKFNLRLLVSEDEPTRQWAAEVLLRLLTIARSGTDDKDEASPEKLAEALVRWAQKGETGGPFKPGGGGLGEEAMDRRFLTLQELLFIEGFTPQMLYGDRTSARDEAGKIDAMAVEAGLEDEAAGYFSTGGAEDEAETGDEEDERPVPLSYLLTVFGDGRVNINTAPVQVLRALHPEMTPELAALIDEKRKESPLLEDEQGAEPAPAPDPGANQAGEMSTRDALPGFRGTSEIREIEGVVDAGKSPPMDMHADLAGRIKVKSRFFTVRVLVKNERLAQRFEAVIQAGDEEADPQPETETKKDGESEGDGSDQSGVQDDQNQPAQPAQPAADAGSAAAAEPETPKLSKIRILRFKSID